MEFKVLFLVICVFINLAKSIPVDDAGDELPPIRQPAALKDNLMNLLLEIRKRMHMEIPSLGLPILEPAKIDDRLELDFDATEIGLLKGSFEKLTIVGLQGFIPEQVDFKLAAFPFLFNLTVPQLQIDGLFSIDSLIGNMLGLTGTGDFNLTISNLNVYLKGRLHFGNTIWTMPELDLQMKLDKLETHFNGLYGGDNEYEDFINLALSELGATILNEVYPDFKPTFTKLVVDMAESALVNKTVEDLMNIANGKIDLPPLDD